MRYSPHRRLAHLLALSSVPRWSIVPGLPPQTVGAHTTNVQLLVWWLMTGGVVGMEPHAQGLRENMTQAFWHDFGECLTGDIPSPGKRLCEASSERLEGAALDALGVPAFRYDNNPILKLADLLDALYWARMGSSTLAKWAADGLATQVQVMLTNPPHGLNLDAAAVALSVAMGDRLP